MNKFSLYFEVAGKPQGKGRARSFIRGGKIGHYTPKDTATYENLVKLSAIAEMGKRNLSITDNPVFVRIYAFFEVPKSFSKKKREQALNGEIVPTTKPDIDNIVKAILDGMNGAVYKDDKQVVCLFVGKKYGENSSVIVEVTEYE